MTIAWTFDDYLRLECEDDAKEPEIVYADEPCAHCGGQILETDEVITRGHSFHESCATFLFGE